MSIADTPVVASVHVRLTPDEADALFYFINRLEAMAASRVLTTPPMYLEATAPAFAKLKEAIDQARAWTQSDTG